MENFAYEEIRRKVFSDIKDVSYYVKDKLNNLKQNSKNEKEIENVLENFDHRIKYRIVLKI